MLYIPIQKMLKQSSYQAGNAWSYNGLWIQEVPFQRWVAPEIDLWWSMNLHEGVEFRKPINGLNLTTVLFRQRTQWLVQSKKPVTSCKTGLGPIVWSFFLPENLRTENETLDLDVQLEAVWAFTSIDGFRAGLRLKPEGWLRWERGAGWSVNFLDSLLYRTIGRTWLLCWDEIETRNL